MRTLTSVACLALLLFTSCGTGPKATCDAHFKPYPDLVSNRVRTPHNELYVDGMALYAKQDYAGAIPLLEEFTKRPNTDKSVHLYLACCYLATGRPYDAELEIDRLEQGNLAQFIDEADWYTVLCWLCSGQEDRARNGARRIAQGRPHTYKAQAAALLKALGD
jgi:tetratricopeptide (TPR) repeat protein